MKITIDAEVLIQKATKAILDYDDAYPDVGMGKPKWLARKEAIVQLKKEKLLPPTYHDQSN